MSTAVTSPLNPERGGGFNQPGGRTLTPSQQNVLREASFEACMVLQFGQSVVYGNTVQQCTGVQTPILFLAVRKRRALNSTPEYDAFRLSRRDIHYKQMHVKILQTNEPARPCIPAACHTQAQRHPRALTKQKRLIQPKYAFMYSDQNQIPWTYVE